ncbi:MAG: hypothetical protein IKL16_04230, partial [Clostridia bacterium]|nr:hypothetical protein [Clostridia bacterium]
MKKILSFILALVIFVMIPLEISAVDSAEKTLSDYELLSDNPSVSSEIRERKKVDGLRMYVDEENPLFMIRNCPRFLPNPTPYDIAYEAVLTYWAIPEDMKPFTVIYIDEGPTYLNPEQQLKFWDEFLGYTDEYNVPVVLQSECFCTNKEREPFTQEQLSGVFKKHESMMGFVQVELSTNGVTNEHLATDVVTNDMGVNKNILARLKSCIKACAENGGLFIWQDKEYIYWKKNNYVNHILKDRELYDLLKANTENVIIMDKHNGHGRHFASQANIMGCWLDDVCGNWGVNLENFLWYEEGFTEYDNLGVKPNEPDFAYTSKYPPALYGIDMIADLLGGATVYAIEGTFSRGGLYHWVNDNVVMTPTFYDVLYPFYRMVLDGAVPSKEQVKEKIKVAYKMTLPASYPLRGNDAHFLQGLYCPSFTFFQEKFENIYLDCTKKWVPSTGRYHIIPILPIYSAPEEVLPDSYILGDLKYFFNFLFINPLKEKFFNEKYEETYTGDGVLFDINGYALTAVNTGGDVYVQLLLLFYNALASTTLTRVLYNSALAAATGARLLHLHGAKAYVFKYPYGAAAAAVGASFRIVGVFCTSAVTVGAFFRVCKLYGLFTAENRFFKIQSQAVSQILAAGGARASSAACAAAEKAA